jgi:hypothetical protein
VQGKIVNVAKHSDEASGFRLRPENAIEYPPRQGLLLGIATDFVAGDLMQQLGIRLLGTASLAAQPVQADVGRHGEQQRRGPAVVQRTLSSQQLDEDIVHGVPGRGFVAQEAAAPAQHHGAV